jgi:signal transduction histidine kinase
LLFAAITRQFDSELDASLRSASGTLADVVRARGAREGPRQLVIPDRRLALFDDSARVVYGRADPWMTALVERSLRNGSASDAHHDGDQTIRASATAFRTDAGARYVAVALADEIEVEDRYTALIITLTLAAVVATALVAVGGWIVARKSTEPAERAMEHLRRFVADAAHELRTPISVVRTRAEVALQKPRDPSEYVFALDAIDREATRLGRIVEDLLTLSRADAGGRTIERQRVFLDDIALDAAEALRAIADRRGIRLIVDGFEETPIAADPMLMRQLVTILLDNAIKFSRDNGEVTLGVRQDGRRAILRVADRGIGIPPEQLPHVFERFYRGDAARSRAGTAASDGTGLGLSIAHWIAEAHDATIELQSVFGEGTMAIVAIGLHEAGVSLS